MDHNLVKTQQYLADNIINLRKKRKLTQEGLSKVSGVPRSTITHAESGSGNPSLQVLLKICNGLQVSLEELLAKPLANCQLVKAKDLPTTLKCQGEAVIKKVLLHPIPGTNIERMDLTPGTSFRGVPHVRGTKEYFSCFQGTFSVKVASEEYIVEKGDVLIFPGDQNHVYSNVGKSKGIGFSVVLISL